MKLRMMGTKAGYNAEKCGFFYSKKISYSEQLDTGGDRLHNCWYKAC